MTWFYASGGQQMGPVEEAALDDLVRQGVVRDDTLVWRQGLPGWQPHGTARPRPAVPVPAPAPPPAAPVSRPASSVQAAAPAPASSGPSWSNPPGGSAAPQAAPAQEMRFCSNCGRPTPVSQLTTVSGASICAACLPSVSGPGPSPAAQPSYQQGGYQQAGYQPAPAYQPADAYPAPGAYAPAAPYPQGAMAGQSRYGGFWIRFLARFIDFIILFIVGMIIRLPLTLMMGGLGLGLGRSPDPAVALAALPALFGVLGLSILINIGVAFLYEVYFLSSRGATPGKMALGLKVVRADGGPLNVGLAVGRYFAYVLSCFTFFIGFIIAGFDDEKRALHDRICNTRVIKL